MTACRSIVDDGWHRGMLRSPTRCVAGGAAPPWLVVKIGGSLLSRPRWPGLLAQLLGELDPRPCRLVVGGGAIVEGLRAIDRAEPQPAALVHSLAIDAMRLTTRLVSSALGLPVVTAPDRTVRLAVIDVPAWLDATSWGARLPAGWQVTSDTIAACVAVEHCGGLLLAKSVPPPRSPGIDPIAEVAAAGWADEHFPVAAAELAEIGWAAAGEA